MKRNNRTVMSFRERLFAALAFTFLLVTYQKVLLGYPVSLSQSVNKVFSYLSTSGVFPKLELLTSQEF